MRILASNEISTLDVMCHILVMPRVGSITADLTAAYYMQLEAVIRSDTGMCTSMSLSSHQYNYVLFVLYCTYWFLDNFFSLFTFNSTNFTTFK